MENIFDNTYSIYFISFLTFISVILLVESAYLFWVSMDVEGNKQTNRRLRALSASGMETKEALSLLDTKYLSHNPWLNTLLNNIPRMHALDRGLEQAGIDITISRYLAIQLLISIALLILLKFLFGLPYYYAIPLAVLAGSAIPWTILSIKQNRRREQFRSQLPNTLDYIARSLRAGNPFTVALQSASEEMPIPTSTEFEITFDELNFGLDLESVLHNLSERTACEEIRYFITAVLVQKETGGNLADILNRIANVMRSRLDTKREVRVLSAEMDYSARVLIFLPFILAGVLMIVNPTYLSVLFEHELGWAIIGAQIFLMAVGYLIIKRMINFRV